MIYQDRWVNGVAVEKGYRECANRYEIIRSFCAGFDRPFTVCDIGANMCYFGLRLTEDFPTCMVIAFEYDHFRLRADHLKANDARRVFLFNRHISIPDLYEMASCCRFDVVLALSILHHQGGLFENWIDALKSIGDNLIVELAVNDSDRSVKRKMGRMPSGGEILGLGDSHLNPNVKRPIVLVRGKEDAR